MAVRHPRHCAGFFDNPIFNGTVGFRIRCTICTPIQTVAVDSFRLEDVVLIWKIGAGLATLLY